MTKHGTSWPEIKRDWKFWVAMVFLVGLVFGAFLTTCSEAEAQDFTVCWTPPEARTDGTPMNPDTELASYSFEAAKGGNWDVLSIQETRPNSTAYSCDIFNKSWNGVGYFRALVTDNEGLYSTWSNEAKVSPSPNPPGNVKRTAYHRKFGPRRVDRGPPMVVYLAWQ